MVKIVVADDSQLIRKILVTLFNSEPDFEVVGEARDGFEAVNQVNRLHPDVLVLDLMMPKLNGVDVLKYIRSTPALKETPVIILSNAHMTSLAQEAAAIGAERALLKSSCTPGQLIDVINDLLSGKAVESDPSKRFAVPALPPTKPQS